MSILNVGLELPEALQVNRGGCVLRAVYRFFPFLDASHLRAVYDDFASRSGGVKRSDTLRLLQRVGCARFVQEVVGQEVVTVRDVRQLGQRALVGLQRPHMTYIHESGRIEDRYGVTDRMHVNRYYVLRPQHQDEYLELIASGRTHVLPAEEECEADQRAAELAARISQCFINYRQACRSDNECYADRAVSDAEEAAEELREILASGEGLNVRATSAQADRNVRRLRRSFDRRNWDGDIC